MVSALEAYGVKGYELRAYQSRGFAIRDAARILSATQAPVILIAWRGAHTWVMTGFRADADPTIFKDADILGAYIFDPWFPRTSSIWGASDGPGAFQDEAEMAAQLPGVAASGGRLPGARRQVHHRGAHAHDEGAEGAAGRADRRRRCPGTHRRGSCRRLSASPRGRWPPAGASEPGPMRRMRPTSTTRQEATLTPCPAAKASGSATSPWLSLSSSTVTSVVTTRPSEGRDHGQQRVARGVDGARQERRERLQRDRQRERGEHRRRRAPRPPRRTRRRPGTGSMSAC